MDLERDRAVGFARSVLTTCLGRRDVSLVLLLLLLLLLDANLTTGWDMKMGITYLALPGASSRPSLLLLRNLSTCCAGRESGRDQ